MASGSDNQSVRLRDVSTRHEMTVPTPAFQTNCVFAFAFDGSGEVLGLKHI
jgi:hypothetical protein